MNKKYKLIKWYPSLPRDWDEGDVVEFSSGLFPYQVENKRGYVEIKEVEDYPEFWEELVEKDYEIVSLKFNDRILTVGEEIISEKAIEDWLLDNSSIHSVKRLSDGEVFTVGDKITYINCKAVRTIKSFTIEEGKLVINANRKCGTIDYHINCIEKAKQPLFTTEDGVDIYAGDTYYYVYKYVNALRIDTIKSASKVIAGRNSHKYFSTKEKAHEYIDLHEKKYSKSDIREYLDKWFASKTRLITIDIETNLEMSTKLTNEFINFLSNE